MSTHKYRREIDEIDNLFKDPKYARRAFKAIGAAIAASPAKVTHIVDKDGNDTQSSQLEQYAYNSLKNDIDILVRDDKDNPSLARPITELELMMKCQFIKARTDTSAAVFIRDTLGAKPVDESKIDQTITDYAGLTDEELEMLAKAREAKKDNIVDEDVQ